MPRPASCIYTIYEETYRATERALTASEVEPLRAVAAAIERLEGVQALAATTGAFDAMNQMPLRSLVHVCRLRLDPACKREECECRPAEGGRE